MSEPTDNLLVIDAISDKLSQNYMANNFTSLKKV